MVAKGFFFILIWNVSVFFGGGILLSDDDEN